MIGTDRRMSAPLRVRQDVPQGHTECGRGDLNQIFAEQKCGSSKIRGGRGRAPFPWPEKKEKRVGE